jgi:hypothetical protein
MERCDGKVIAIVAYARSNSTLSAASASTRGDVGRG